MCLTSLPIDVLLVILRYTALRELVALSEACRFLNWLVNESGWTVYLQANPRPSFSLRNARRDWSTKKQVIYDSLVDRSWSDAKFIARPLSRPWVGKKQPILGISPSRLVVASGSDLISYRFHTPESAGTPPVRYEGTYSFASLHSVITSIAFIDDGGLDQTLFVSLYDGTLQQVFLEPPSQDGMPLTAKSFIMVKMPDGDYMESLSSERNVVLSLTSKGCVALYNANSSVSNPSAPPAPFLDQRCWTSHLCLDSSSPYAAFGVSHSSPLKIHSITSGGLAQTPALYPAADMEYDSTKSILESAVYGISRAPLASPWGASPEIIVAGWYDGMVRCYDMRSSLRLPTPADLTGSTALRPVLVMRDPMQREPIYSVSCGGGSASHIAAGSARHSVVCFWDVRAPERGWSVHAPGNDRSPVYSVILESSRAYGATQNRPFVFDFGSEVAWSTYPPLPEGRGVDGLKRKKGSDEIGYYVTKYSHATERLFKGRNFNDRIDGVNCSTSTQSHDR